MPDLLAHYLFAQRMLAACPALKERISPDSWAFRLGSFGPDPLFNDFSAHRRSQGFAMHRRPGREALERLRSAVREERPCAAAYAAGFFSHYALDRLCHPDLRAMDARGEARHVPTEAAYDRALFLRGAADLPRRPHIDMEICSRAAELCDGVSAQQFRQDIANGWRLRRMLLLGGGTLLSRIPDKLNPAWEGIIPHGTPSEGTLRGIALLDGWMEKGVPEAAEQLELFFHAIGHDLPLDKWTDADFNGKLP